MLGINSIAAMLVLSSCGLQVHMYRPIPGSGLVLESDDAECKDEGIWIADTHLDCSHLVRNTGDWGLVGAEARKRCKGDPNTKCCQTCRDLGFSYGHPPRPSGGNTQQPTPAPPTAAPPNRVPPGKCKDEGIWIADTHLDCSHLVRNDGEWGLNGAEARKRCQGDSNTKCCQTCRDLGFNNDDPTRPSGTGNTQQPTPATSTAAPPSRTLPDQSGTPCKDQQIWIMDMSIDCSHLEKRSMYGVNKNPEYYCTRDALTDCCETCTRLGFPRRGGGGGSNTNKPATTTTKAPPTTTPTPKPTTTTRKVIAAGPVWRPLCQDIGIFFGYGMISCKYLEKKSWYGLHVNPLQSCNNRWSTWCCETCARIRGKSSQNAISYNLWGFKTPTIRKSKISNKII